ncbi:MAG TPA: CPBP family glutamic-type intramembrane protease [Steroidobacter sp.]|uniref:CPBP family glutamic-type intramembrane protease n=1 Tax=Steroidobacter sp. TaxID=1978227 RepID=UPI002ED8411B
MHVLALRAAERWRDAILLALVFMLIFSFIWGWQGSFPGATAVFGAALIGLLFAGNANFSGSLRESGIRLDTASHAATLLAPLVASIIALTMLAGYLLDSLDFPTLKNAWISLFEAFAFGLAQQYVLLAFFYRGLERLMANNALAVVATALVFAIFHLPNPFLTSVTLVAGLLSVAVYRRAPNLWINGLAHGLISYHLYHALPLWITGALRVGPGYLG